jgi:signal transduction histidine kinase
VTDNRSTALYGSSRALLDAVIAISTDLDLHRVLTRIVESATELTGARYGALGVLGREDGLQNFVVHGIDPDLQARIGDLPHGRGILGAVIDDPRPLRLTDLTQQPASYGFPPHHPPMQTFLGVPITVQGTVFGNLYLTEKAGGVPFTDADEELVIALAGAAGYVVANARAYGLSERRRHGLEATSRIADALQPPVSWDDAFAEITNTLRAAAGAGAVGLVQRGDDGQLLVAAVDGPDAALVDEVLQRMPEGLTEAAEGSDVLQVPLDAEPRWTVLLPLRSALAGSIVLVVVLAEEEQAADADERQLMQSFADHVGLALDRAQALEDRQELAVVSDRDRIARDLHDLVIQRLFATGMHLQGVRMLADRPDFVDRLDKAVDDIDLTIKDIRGTIFELQHRNGSSLRADVRKLAKEYAPLLGFTPAVRTIGPVDTAVPEPVQVELLAVLREALSNTAKHALADSASVDVEVGETTLTLRVTDDGGGLPEDRQESGLRNARRRAARLGGAFELTPGVPAGTVFTWRVPLH